MNAQHLHTFIFLLILIPLLGMVPLCAAEPPPPDGPLPQTVYVIPVQGEVEPSMAAFIDRAFQQTAQDKEALYVLEIDTFGGQVDTALQIVDTILTVAPNRTIAFVKTKAISAGALIALANGSLVMRPNTTIGDCAPITYSNEGPKMLGEKFQSPLRAKFRTLARRNGYPPRLAEAMVSQEMEVYEVELENERKFFNAHELENLESTDQGSIISRKKVVSKGELLTMDDAEALELGFSKMSSQSIELMLEKMNIAPEIIRLEPTWSEALGRLIGSISSILLILGLAGLYAEIKSPGFGFPGLIGLFCLGLVFLNQYMVGLADHTELLLLALGIVFLGLEVFVLPGFGLAGIAGFGLIGTGLILAFQDFVIPAPDMPWQMELLTRNGILVLGSGIGAMVASLLFFRYLLPGLDKVVEGPYLRTSLVQAHADSVEAKGVSAGERGRTSTPLRPSGKMKYGHKIIDVVSEGEFIDQDSEVEIAKIQGNRIIVRRVEQ